VEVVIDYAPRPLQRVIHDALDRHQRAVAVCHRRFGKTVLAVNQLQKAALTCPKPRPRFAYIAPTFTQGKSIAWDYMKHYAAPIPGHTVNESELRIDYPNGGQVRIYGADNPDRLRGLYFDGVVFDEYGLMPPRTFTEVVSPTLIDRQGWAFFIGTPNGKNQFYDICFGDGRNFAGAANDPQWYFATFKASETHILPAEYLKAEQLVMTPDEYAQEYECSFEASVKGAIYAREILQAKEQGRITRVPYDPALPVDTDWDLGVGDATAIWFSQTLYTGEVRLIDYYEHTGQGLQHYKQVLNERGYTYGNHWAPHDIQVRELTSGHSRLDTARTLGLNFLITPRIESLEDGIHSARMLLPRCWFDADKCKRGLEALQAYHWDFNTRIHEFKHLPVHDWASHGADAFRGLAYRHFTPKYNFRREQQDLRRAQADPGETFRWRPVRANRGGY